MTLRTPVYALAAVVAACPLGARAGVGSATGPAVTVQVPDAPTVGRATSVACSAVDPDGIARLTVTATGPDGAASVLAVVNGVTST